MKLLTVRLVLLLIVTGFVTEAAAGANQNRARVPHSKVSRPQRKKRTSPRPAFTPELARLIAAVALREGIDPLLVLEVMRQESGFNPQARSGRGALGLMQIVTPTARRFGITDASDPHQAITGGCRYLRYLTRRYGSRRLDLILAAYNAGEGTIERFRRQVPPYRETQEYVRRVTALYGEAVRVRAAVSPQPLTAAKRR